MRMVGARSGVVLEPLSDSVTASSDPGLVGGVRTWVRTFLMRPHAELGRSGPVCPYTAPSLAKNLFWVGVVEGADISVEQMSAIADDVIDAYAQIPPQAGQEAIFKAIVVVFPDVTDYSVIDKVQRAGKDRVIQQGMMLGQFYPGCVESGLWNPDFRPLDAPYPMLAIRQMVGTDFPFLTSQREWLTAYMKRFAPAVPSTVRTTIIERMLPVGSDDRAR
jgi:hypothetical protein